ncbi:MAG: hypothetical protein CUN55_09260 [Phototrophicales bacterium]|nr:MAG: hypothetical protein CUN55_09260 [Phototrophicales bacterium]
MAKRIFLIILFGLLSTLLISGSFLPTPVNAQETEVQFSFINCPNNIEYPPNRKIDCGRLIVPENRRNPNGNVVQLTVFIVRARSENPLPDPIVYLTGGPGGSISAYLRSFEYVFGAYALNRDMILMDQRGTGLSEPNLKCEEFGLADFEAYVGGYTLEEGAQHAADALVECLEFYRERGIDLNAYTSAENAADFADLRQALGIEQWNLYGVSYGTRLALTIMRDHPEGIRSVVLDSVVPPQARLYIETPLNGAAALDHFFDLCEADPICNTTYPDLERKFYELVDRLNAEPLQVEVRRRADGKYYTANLSGDVLVGVMFFNMYSTTALQYLPYMIQQAYDGFIGPLRQDFLPSFFAWDGIATVMHYSVNCNEEIAFDTFADIETASDTLDPRLQLFYDMDNYITYYICQNWNAPPPDPIEDDPVVSDIPTLILSGELDPVTPPRWGELAAATLSNAQVIVVPYAGHGVTFTSDCPRDLVRWFLNDPQQRLDTSCLREIEEPRFYVSEN